MDSSNTLIRSRPCPICGGAMLWTQNAWPLGPGSGVSEGVELTGAAYRCTQGHMLNPATTRQCPACGIHDTEIIEQGAGTANYECLQCGNHFSVSDIPPA